MSEQSKPASKSIVLRNYLRSDDMIESFASAIGNPRNAKAYISSVLLAVQENDKLLECAPKSIAISAMRAAALQLSCDKSTGQAWLVPYGKKAALIVGYKGLRDMAMRTGLYKTLNVAEIYEGQEVIEDQVRGRITITGKKDKSKPIIGYNFYLEATRKPGQYECFEAYLYMSVEEIEAHKVRYAKGYTHKDSVWKTNTEGMYRKTVMRLGLLRHATFDPHDTAALALDVDDESVSWEDDNSVPDFNEEDHQPASHGTYTQIISALGYDDDDVPPPPMPEPPPFIDVDPETGEVQMQEKARATFSREVSAAAALKMGDVQLGDKSANELQVIVDDPKMNPGLKNAAQLVLDWKIAEAQQTI